MLFLIAMILFLVVLKTQGRVGPFVWDGPTCDRRSGSPARHRPESVPADRLVSGDITPEEYLERLSLLEEK